MQYEAPRQGSVQHFLTECGDFFRSSRDAGPILEWSEEEPGSELLLCDGAPLVRLACTDRRWSWRVLDGEARPIRAGSRAEARLLASFYARRGRTA